MTPIVAESFKFLLSDLLRQITALPPEPAKGAAPQHDDEKVRRIGLGFNFYLRKRIIQLAQWADSSNEGTNFTYDLADLNLGHLAGWVSTVSGSSIEMAVKYIEELRADPALREHLNQKVLHGGFPHLADLNMGYGRRLGWYALVRILKPRLVIETGVDKGLGSCVLCTALLRNKEEGFDGRYLGTDINPQAGYLLSAPYSSVGEILYGDSLTSLQALNTEVDLFINDSDHSAEYETLEYNEINRLLSPKAVVLGDNSHATDSLFKFAKATNKRFTFFAESPKDHWYPGAGIGAAY